MSWSAWSTIFRLRQASEPLAWWRNIRGVDFVDIRPFLTPCVGLAGHVYPCPHTGLPLAIRETHGRYAAFPTGDNCEDTEDIALSWDDAQAWRLDMHKLREAAAAAFALRGGSADGGEGDIHLLGVCGAHEGSRRVYLCCADDADAAARLAGDAGRTPDAGCLVFAEPHAGAEQILAARGAGLVALSECAALTADGLSGACGNACLRARPDLTNRELKQHFDGRFDTVGREFTNMQRENDLLKENLAQALARIFREVEPEFFQWIFVMLGAGSVNAAARELKMAGSTFAARVQQYAARGGVYKTLFSMVRVRQKGAGQKRVERFNELFAEHQAARADAAPGVLRALLDGLEDLNGNNWPGMRRELIEMVKDELPEE